MSQLDSIEAADVCWICLESGAEADSELIHPCDCPRLAHQKCLAKWQLHSAGKPEEKECRFCSKALPDWREGLGDGSCSKIRGTAWMTITHMGRMRRVRVHAGEAGRLKFEEQVRRFLGIANGERFETLFECKAPDTGEDLELRGLSAWDAAVHCAAMCGNDVLPISEARTRFINVVNSIQSRLSNSMSQLCQSVSTVSSKVGGSIRNWPQFSSSTWKPPSVSISIPCMFCAFGPDGNRLERTTSGHVITSMIPLSGVIRMGMAIPMVSMRRDQTLPE